MAEAIPLPSIRRYAATQDERLFVCKVKLQSLLLYFRFLFCMLTGVAHYTLRHFVGRHEER